MTYRPDLPEMPDFSDESELGPLGVSSDTKAYVRRLGLNAKGNGGCTPPFPEPISPEQEAEESKRGRERAAYERLQKKLNKLRAPK